MPTFHSSRRLRCRPSHLWLLLLVLSCSAAALASNHSRLAASGPQNAGSYASDPALHHTDLTYITPWIHVHVERGDTLSALFNQLGLATSQWRAILSLDETVAALRHLNPGDTFHLRKTLGGRLAVLHFPIGPIRTLVIRRTPDGLVAGIKQPPTTTRRVLVHGLVGKSFPDSLRDAGTPAQIANALAHVFAPRLDLSRVMNWGDRFSIIYAIEFVDGDRVAIGPIIAASLHTNGQYFRAFRHVDRQGAVHYYDPRGQPYTLDIARTPLDYAYVTSPFDMHRLHPVLGVVRPHTGVDLAAPRGTPVHAAADGTVTFVGWISGYGRMVKIDHPNGYSTRYAHLSGFADGLEAGEHVSKGDTIGYVGASGLATGYHLHFEIRRYGTPHNPLTMELPSAESLAGTALTEFVNKIQPLIAKMNGPPAAASTLIAGNANRSLFCPGPVPINPLARVASRHGHLNPLFRFLCSIGA